MASASTDRRPEEADRRRAQRRLRARALAVGERGPDGLHGQPVAGALVAQYVTPAAGPPGAPGAPHPEHIAAGPRDRADARLGAGGRRPGADHVVDHHPRARASLAHVGGHRVGVGARDRQHGRVELLARDPGSPDRLVGGLQQGLRRRARAHRVGVARGAVAEMERGLACLRPRSVPRMGCPSGCGRRAPPPASWWRPRRPPSRSARRPGPPGRVPRSAARSEPAAASLANRAS